ncbi:MAG TPA: peptide-methionine (S)-S-oxide reductase MsrA [Sphingomicrobium sp.]|nr:peptide-methionine (S)-S-oxide reductase MsrA [Sphingomicrobium sp.]
MIAAILASPANAAQTTETAVLAGGCFWGMELVFEHVKGVSSVVSGYAGGSAGDANYEAVSSERTGHAEAIRIRYDPSQIRYSQLLDIYFTVAHNPTELDRQGPDHGHSYRSAIFPQSPEQERVARAIIAKLGAMHVYPNAIVTRIEHGNFYPAEAYHQAFARNHPLYPYIVINDRPKVDALRHRFGSLYKS